MYSYLALGDSYTIGEQVPIAHSFPYQTVQLLRKDGFEFYAAEIVAVTGWTSDELKANMNELVLLPNYDFVTILAGVNNQYRENSIDIFKKDFDELIQRSLVFTNGKEQNVFVLSIPDWGITPFAEGKDREKIAREIDEYNNICAKLSRKHQITFIDITSDQRKSGNETEYLAGDQLHPSGKEYAKWANALFKAIKFSIVNG